MALVSTRHPYGDNGSGHWGPFRRSNGDTYAFTVNWNQIIPNASSGAAWSERSGVSLPDDVFSGWVEYDEAADVFHVAAMIPGSVRYLSYNPVTNSWSSAEVVNSHSHGGSPGYGVVLKQAPDGDLWFFYQNDYQTIGSENYFRLALSHRTGANTYTKYSVDAGGTIWWTVGSMAIQSTGLVDLFYGSWETRVYHRSFNPSTGLFGTQREVSDSAASFAVHAAKRVAYYDDDGVSRLTFVWRGPGGQLSAATLDNDGVPTAEISLSASVAVWDSDNSAAATVVADADVKTVYAVFASGSNVYVRSSVDGGAWSAASSLVSGVTARFVDASIYVNAANHVMLGILYDVASAGTSFLEFELRDAASPITIALNTAYLSLSAPSVTVTPGAKTVALNPAYVSLYAPPIEVVPGAKSVELQPASIALIAPPVTVTPGAKAVALQPAFLALTAPPITVAPGAKSIGLSTAVLSLEAPPVVVMPGAKSIGLNVAALTLVAPPVSVTPGAKAIALSTAVLTLSAPSVTLSPGAKSIALNVGTLTLSALSVGIETSGAITVALKPAVIHLSAPSIQVTPGAKSIELVPASISVHALPVTVTPGAKLIALKPASLALTALPIGVPVGPIEILLSVATLHLTAPPLRVFVVGAAGTVIAADALVTTLFANADVVTSIEARDSHRVQLEVDEAAVLNRLTVWHDSLVSLEVEETRL